MTKPTLFLLKLLLFTFTLLSYSFVSAQEYTVIHYDQAKGFPADYGYGLFEDRQGYIWISTENGLLRFNGYEFKLFSTKDGLPDNEVFGLAEDHQGRIWFSPFTNSIGYIENEKIHHPGNDTLLRKLRFKTRPDEFAFPRNGDILIREANEIYVILKKGGIKKFRIGESDKHYFSFHKPATGEVYLINDSNLYLYDETRFRKIRQMPSIGTFEQGFIYNQVIAWLGDSIGIPFLYKTIGAGIPFFSDRSERMKLNAVWRFSPQKFAFSRKDGCFLVDIATGRITDTLLKGYNVSPSAINRNGTIWMGTHGNGLFRFINTPVRSLTLPDTKSAVLFIRGTATGMECVGEGGRFIKADFDLRKQLNITLQSYINKDRSQLAYIYYGQNKVKNWISCSHETAIHRRPGNDPFALFATGYCKEVLEDGNDLIIASSGGTFRINSTNLTMKKLSPVRATSVAKLGNTIYSGTLNGLLAGSDRNPFKRVLPAESVLNRRITKLCAGTDSILWVANNKAELIAVKHNRIITIINENMGLRCNRISALKASSKYIWIGTDNGLYAVKNEQPYVIVRHLTYTSGLNSNLVNCLDVQKGKVWIGTSKGVNYFDEQDLLWQQPVATFVINSIRNGDIDISADQGVMKLSQKTLTINFDLIDHSGGQRPLYQYRLDNDSNWILLENSNLYFVDAPYGYFTVSIKALSPNNVNESIHQLRFHLPYPFYMQWKFILMVSISFACLLVAGIRFFIRRVRKKDQEKLAVHRNLLQLEQMALQGQMNPHFIFNCIAAIKQYYNSGEIQKANKLVDTFASLIRQTFDMSADVFVTLDKELDYLVKYLEVEQVRFNHSFTFSIIKNTMLDDSRIPVPAMLLQPVVENAIRHGVRHLAGIQGNIMIHVVQVSERVEITITDNGIGREKSKRFRYAHGTYTSTTVNKKRIAILNRLFEQQIVHRTEDRYDPEHNIAGTIVFISYPVDIKNLSPLNIKHP